MQKEPLKFPPSPRHQHWLLGNLLDFRRNHNSIPYLQEKQKELGDIHWIRLPWPSPFYCYPPGLYQTCASRQ
ncbi:MAG: hypothetical protein HC913_16745 [Microscillaceae bacterium]|nr:hypothetical protein [Microscillaceae bacterium]